MVKMYWNYNTIQYMIHVF